MSSAVSLITMDMDLHGFDAELPFHGRGELSQLLHGSIVVNDDDSLTKRFGGLLQLLPDGRLVTLGDVFTDFTHALSLIAWVDPRLVQVGKVLADVTQFFVAQVVTLTACFHRLDVDACFSHSIEKVG